MELSITMRFVMVRAQAEIYGTGSDKVYPEHIFLGILKLAESSAEKDFSSVAYKGDIDDDIRQVGKLLGGAGISPGSLDAVSGRGGRAHWGCSPSSGSEPRVRWR